MTSGVAIPAFTKDQVEIGHYSRSFTGIEVLLACLTVEQLELTQMFLMMFLSQEQGVGGTCVHHH
jgi:hypothetical protein